MLKLSISRPYMVDAATECTPLRAVLCHCFKPSARGRATRSAAVLLFPRVQAHRDRTRTYQV